MIANILDTPWCYRKWAMLSDTDWLWVLHAVKDSVDRPTEEQALRRISGQAAYAELIRRSARFVGAEG